jgi:hypothetical protein
MRVLLIVFVLGTLGVLWIVGLLTLIRWLKLHYPRQTTILLLLLAGLGAAAVLMLARELRQRPEMAPGDLLTLQEPLVVRMRSEQGSSRRPCVIDLYEHLGVEEIGPMVLTATVESNNRSSAFYCPVGESVEVEVDRIHHPTVTRR